MPLCVDEAKALEDQYYSRKGYRKRGQDIHIIFLRLPTELSDLLLWC